MTYKIGVLVCMMGIAQSVEWSQVWQRLDEMLEYVPFGPEKILMDFSGNTLIINVMLLSNNNKLNVDLRIHICATNSTSCYLIVSNCTHKNTDSTLITTKRK